MESRVSREVRAFRWAVGVLAGALLVPANSAASASAWGSDSGSTPDKAPPQEDAALPQDPPGDLTTPPWPPPVQLNVSFTGRYPYQAMGLGVELALYPTSWLRLGALYAPGFAAISHKSELTFAQYAEGTVGFALFRISGRRAIELPLRQPAEGHQLPAHAEVPTYHALFLEGGAMTGFIQPDRCDGNCNAVFVNNRQLVSEDYQLVMAFGGVRYVYFWNASSEMSQFQKKVHVQLYAHLIGKPFNAPDHPLQNSNNDLKSSPVGGRVGILGPVCLPRCFTIGVELGYNPYPAGVLLGMSIGY